MNKNKNNNKLEIDKNLVPTKIGLLISSQNDRE